jgi:hypothetical protein
MANHSGLAHSHHRHKRTTALSYGNTIQGPELSVEADMKLSTASTKEQEHEWRELLQKQLAEHWLDLYFPEETKPNKELILAKIRGSGGKAA